jgi:hypothetical protein
MFIVILQLDRGKENTKTYEKLPSIPRRYDAGAYSSVVGDRAAQSFYRQDVSRSHNPPAAGARHRAGEASDIP